MVRQNIIDKVNQLLDPQVLSDLSRPKGFENIQQAHRLLSSVGGLGRTDAKWKDICRDYEDKVNIPLLDLEEQGSITFKESNFYLMVCGPFDSSFTYDDARKFRLRVE